MNSLLEWMNKNRKEWLADPVKERGFRAREDKVATILTRIHEKEEQYRKEFDLSAVAMARLVDLYNLPKE